MSMKIEISVTVGEEQTGLHVLACDHHQDMLVSELEQVVVRLTQDATAEIGVAQLGTISVGDLPYDESMWQRRPKGAESLLAAIKESIEAAGGIVSLVRINDESDIADAPDSAFMKPTSA